MIVRLKEWNGSSYFISIEEFQFYDSPIKSFMLKLLKN